MTQTKKIHPAEFWRQTTVGLFYLMIVIVPFVFTWVNDELFEFNKLIAVYFFTVLITTAYLTRCILARKFFFKRTPLDIPIGLFLITQLASTLLSIHPYTSIMGYYTRFHGGLLSYMTYIWLFYVFVNTFTKKSLKPLLLSISLAGLGVALYAFPEHFGYSPSCFLISNGAAFDTSCWIQDVKTRVFGTFGQPNWLAAQTIMIILLGIGAFKDKYSKNTNSIIAAAVLLNFLVLIFTKSRSGILGLGIGLLVFLSLKAFQIWQNRDQKITIHKYLIGVLIGIILIAATTGTEFTPSISKLFAQPADQPEVQVSPPVAVNRLEVGGTDSGEIRQIVWLGAVKIWQRYPWFGSGPETFAYSYYLDRPMAHNLVSEWDFLYNKAHNEFLNFLATTGVFGLAGYLILIGSMLWISTKPILANQNQAHQDLLAGITGAMVGLHISNALGFSTVYVTLLLFLFAGITIMITSPDASQAKPQPINSDLYFLVFGTWFVSLIALFMIFSFWKADYLYSQAKSLDKVGQYSLAANYLQGAIQKFPYEAEYQDQLSLTLTKLALTLVQNDQATLGGQIAEQAITHADRALELNPAHLNIYRTRGRIFTYLGSVNPIYLPEADKVLESAIKLAPTDAKLYYNRGLIYIQLEQYQTAIDHLKTALDMKPNYESARSELAKAYIKLNDYASALKEYEYIVNNIADKPEIREIIEELKSQ